MGNTLTVVIRTPNPSSSNLLSTNSLFRAPWAGTT